MTDPRNLKNICDILNSEGCILGLMQDPKNMLYLSSYLKDGSGNVYYSTTEEQLKSFIESKVTIREIYVESKDFLVKHKFRKQIKTYFKEDFLELLQCGTEYYNEIPESMKSKEFEKKYGS